MMSCNTLNDFNTLIIAHEDVISKAIGVAPIKTNLFNDYSGAIKSLGAWGGDFILATSKDNPKDYFKSKGLNTVISYQDMVLNF